MGLNGGLVGLKPVRNMLKPGCFSFKVGQDAIDFGYIYICIYICMVHIYIYFFYYIYMLINLFVYSARKIGMPTESVTRYRELLKSRPD